MSSPDMSVWHLFVNASLLVQLVMVLLLVASVVSWMVIFRRRKVMSAALVELRGFEKQFWSAEDLQSLYQEVAAEEDQLFGMRQIFVTGFREFIRLRKGKSATANASVIEGVQRVMRTALTREEEYLEHHLTFLATVGSISPYVGLFGTVWGIMNSFRALGGVTHATISMVAPGIAEALIATAIGLFAAIPAVVAYNHFSSDVERIVTSYNTFAEDFSALLHRHMMESS